jgi:Rrf2 family protein
LKNLPHRVISTLNPWKTSNVRRFCFIEIKHAVLAYEESAFQVPVMISQKAKYALRALTALARADGRSPMLIADIAEQQNIPKKFLEQILLDLKHRGLVISKRGKDGGYLLLKPAEEITFGEILRMIDGPIAPLPCLSQTAYRKCDDCLSETECEIRHVFARVADATREVLFSATIADALAEKSRVTVMLAG